MSNIYGPPGVGKLSSVFTGDKGGSGLILVKFDDSDPGKPKGRAASKRIFTLPRGTRSNEGAPPPNSLVMLIQDWTWVASERVQPNYTLSETEHIYTFGRTLPTMNVTGLVVNKDVKGARFFSNFNAQTLRERWESTLRARKSGEANKPRVLVQVDELGATFKGVAVNLQINKNLGNEAFVTATLSVLILKGFE